MGRWLEIVNRDFSSPDELAEWAARSGFGRVGLQGGDEAVELCRRMGDALRRLADALVSGRRPAKELAALDAVVASVPGRMRVGLAGVAFGADAPPIVTIAVQLGIEAAEFALDSESPRLARCERDDPPCGKFFIDRSRDGRGRWCSPACGTVERVRKLRSKESEPESA